MATSTLGSNANNSIPQAVAFSAVTLVADIATLNAAMFDDGAVPAGGAAMTRRQWPSHEAKMGFTKDGLLFVPNRGFLKVLPGDWVAVDNRGWPFLLSADTIANGLWTHNP